MSPKPTLTNPTDNELDAAFAEHVAGWKLEYFMCNPPRPTGSGFPPGQKYGVPEAIPRFTRSADAVLPWLEKAHTGTNRTLFADAIWFCKMSEIWTIEAHKPGGEKIFETATTFPKAAVIALLRAYGVVVEFTTPAAFYQQTLTPDQVRDMAKKEGFDC